MNIEVSTPLLVVVGLALMAAESVWRCGRRAGRERPGGGACG